MKKTESKEKVNLGSRVWWDYIHKDLQELLKQSLLLIEFIEKRVRDLPNGRQEFHDYAFVVFPAAKGYEGFLKHLFLDLGFITKETFYGKRFRVGKALNPALEKRFREESVYDNLVKFCNGNELADSLWNTWKTCRNVLFHWFPEERNAIDFTEAKERVGNVLDTMDLAFKECKPRTSLHLDE